MPDEKFTSLQTGNVYDKAGLAAKAREHDPKYKSMSDDDIANEFRSYENWKVDGSPTTPQRPSAAPSAPVRQSTPPPSSRQTRPTGSVQVLRGYEGIPDDQADALAKHILGGRLSLDDMQKRFTSPYDRKKIEKSVYRQGGAAAIPLRTKQLEDMATYTTVYDQLIPAMERLSSLLPKEKNKQIQWVEGKLTGSFTNPEAAQAAGEINAAMTGIGRALYKETRMSDEDARRVAQGVMPQGIFSQELNQRMIDSIRRHAKRQVMASFGGIPKTQWDIILEGDDRKTLRSILDFERQQPAQPGAAQPSTQPQGGAPSWADMKRRAQGQAGSPAKPRSIADLIGSQQ